MLRSKPWLGAVALMLVSGAAWATDSADNGAAEFGVPISQEALDEHRGRESSFELNLQENSATMTNTVAVHSKNGENHISGGAFGGASGFPLAVQNSGNNVIIQNAYIINLDVR